MSGLLPSSTPATAPSGRRRAVSRHRRSRRLPTGRRALLGIAVPVLLLLLLCVAVGVAWALGAQHTGPLPAGVTLVAVLAAVVLVFVVAWRSGVSRLGSVLAAALCAVAPPAVRAASAGVPEHLAVVALLIAVLLLTVRSRRRIMVPLAALAAGLAAGIAPLALAAAPFLAVEAARVLRKRHRIPTLPISGAVFFATVGIGWAVVGFDPNVAPHLGGTTVLDWLRTSPVGAVVAAAALVLGFFSRRSRPLAGFALTVLVLSVWPDGGEPVRYTVLVTPVLALLTAGAADRALDALLRPSPRVRILAAAGAVAVTIALVAGIVVSALEVRSSAVAAESPGSSPADASPSADAATPSATASTPAPGQEARASVGQELARNPRLTLESEASRLLTSGEVDRRIAIVLGQLLSQHDVTVADFPALAGEDGPRRQLFVTAMDGEQLGTQGASMTALTSFLAALTGTFAVDSVSVTDDGVLATFPLPAAGGD
ncbi:hypothetical protein [Naasia aerilata]|uniref:Uncharacterized protein n=1 Tax=Naasia aerilata TaxID=1162966 RepID=A0ABM8GE81_9MICO|nr:hypothetical protein [Naasia aerilata]BDZ46616.1 hypothetical protein GCM10025866_25250 [Naasia aerilata]